ncbi:Leucine-rich repeat protein FLOR 1 [Camellia lanceoleosa]|nr:Leucine-rich repeat protein FLOR 1 [Camellia lanceoleosa]
MEIVKFPNTLKDLDLSRNLVFGKLPKAISGLEKLNVSNNHLCGPIPPNKFPASAFSDNDCLCGSPLSPCKAYCKLLALPLHLIQPSSQDYKTQGGQRDCPLG